MIDNKVREYRLQNHLSQKELACRVGTRRETIGALEKGKHNPSLELAFRIARELDVPVETLFSWMIQKESRNYRRRCDGYQAVG